ncbi:Hypothetical protein SRAE_2000439300 [Strongyloides ratti]|uniref:Acetyltransf_18 domain-containing protein n=1 Tax=Strongyloides ratti TaxID=34506 RepID=A0A090LIX5_STRRB|nr:Hypothetical protein SRAE_2000439300 [Strongyloides ratti]CEF69747.1 Hypothetical protein SRAE_2000439300 [Strongyloides ratti]
MNDSTIYERVIHNNYLPQYLTNAWKSNGWILSENDYETFQKAYGDDFICYVAYENDTKQFYGNIWGLFNRDKYGEIKLFSIASFFVLPLYRDIFLKKYSQIDNWENVFEYDRKFTTNSVDRSKFLKLLFTRNDGYGRVAFNGNGNVVGFIHIRECLPNNLDIGPFYADKQEIAKCLLNSAILEIKLSGKRYSLVLMKILSNNSNCEKLIEEFTNGKMVYNENMYAKFTKSVIPTKEMLVYSMTEYTLSHI